ncbi:glucose-1-phosphate thymidylyltransferase RfbA [Zhenpiania hominis]|uniref:Glucose-1-phosphate thymidylyltransferase n=1 Tax=Zhenpiania hominis TaxID=2763644 RepID=A0A923NM87_9FIRM|nr:glucose-1-phosphate thymidylyltransferase RfbA [Zhenpiania hominis]MBC6679579.1 glucose-1-phosphate thymidylyltransferase RfbA [Zhenpiania hominis]
MKGIILAAGKGTRLYPITKSICKPLLPVYDKPLIYYSISTLMLAGIRDILIIIPDGQQIAFRELLGDGSKFGINIEYAIQDVPRGIADAFIVGERFIKNDQVCLMLGDNIFYHPNLEGILKKAMRFVKNASKATIFGIKVEDPYSFGVVEFDENGRVISIEEKPDYPKSQYAVPGLYFYGNDVIDIAKELKPSARGELEITDVNIEYLNRGKLNVIPLDEEVIWLDAGTVTTLHEAACRVYEMQQIGVYVSYPEKVAIDKGYITWDKFIHEIEEMHNTEYGKHLKDMMDSIKLI